MFPNHKRLGGAPANFACHVQQLGPSAYPVSCVGADELGDEIFTHLSRLGVDTVYVTEVPDSRTGIVDVVLKFGKPTYEIHEDVAWDHIPFTAELSELAEKLDAVCFGSLSQRSEVSKRTIQSFLGKMREGALKIFDVNLRQSYFSAGLLEDSLKLANVLKLSDEELPVLADMFELEGSVQQQLAQLADRFSLRLVAYTRGPEGSLLYTPEESDDFPGIEVQAVDTVGAGDSFTATLCVGLLLGKPLSEVNRFANEVAAYVCSQKGATPGFPLQMASKWSLT
nr:carbohydrate kinase [Pelagicoccus albus]